MGRFRCFPPHLLQPEEARKSCEPLRAGNSLHGCKGISAFAQADEDPFQAALDWCSARTIMLPRATAEQMAAKSRGARRTCKVEVWPKLSRWGQMLVNI